MRGRWAAGIAPRNFAWIMKDQLAVSERPGGFAPHHRRVRRQEEILWLAAHGFTRVVSLLPSNHNLHAYDELHLPASHFALPAHGDARPVLAELYTALWAWLHAGEHVLVHQDELGEQVAGVVAGFLCWSGILPEPPRAVTAVEQLLRRQMGHAGRSIVALAAELPPGPAVRDRPRAAAGAEPADTDGRPGEPAAPAPSGPEDSVPAHPGGPADMTAAVAAPAAPTHAAPTHAAPTYAAPTHTAPARTAAPQKAVARPRGDSAPALKAAEKAPTSEPPAHRAAEKAPGDSARVARASEKAAAEKATPEKAATEKAAGEKAAAEKAAQRSPAKAAPGVQADKAAQAKKGPARQAAPVKVPAKQVGTTGGKTVAKAGTAKGKGAATSAMAGAGAPAGKRDPSRTSRMSPAEPPAADAAPTRRRRQP